VSTNQMDRMLRLIKNLCLTLPDKEPQ